MLVCKQEEQLRAGAAEQEKRLQRIKEDAAAAERRANIFRSDAETQANRIVRLPPETASTGLAKPLEYCQDGRSFALVRLNIPRCEASCAARHHINVAIYHMDAVRIYRHGRLLFSMLHGVESSSVCNGCSWQARAQSRSGCSRRRAACAMLRMSSSSLSCARA